MDAGSSMSIAKMLFLVEFNTPVSEPTVILIRPSESADVGMDVILTALMFRIPLS